MINPKAVEKINKIKFSNRVEIKHPSDSYIIINAGLAHVYIDKAFYRKGVIVDVSWSGTSESNKIVNQFSKDLQEIIKIAEQCKKILIKYEQYEEK